ncbi:hypothetical protein ACTMU2_38100 [Cupriavidus basilensis]
MAWAASVPAARPLQRHAGPAGDFGLKPLLVREDDRYRAMFTPRQYDVARDDGAGQQRVRRRSAMRTCCRCADPADSRGARRARSAWDAHRAGDCSHPRAAATARTGSGMAMSRARAPRRTGIKRGRSRSCRPQVSHTAQQATLAQLTPDRRCQ